VEEIFYALYSGISSTSLPPQAQKAAAATEAAGGQGQFGRCTKSCTEHPTELGNGYLAENAADRLGLNVPQFLRDIGRHTLDPALIRDIESGMQPR